MSLTAAAIIAEAPLGAIVRWSDGSPRPPERHVRKLREWKQSNGQVRLVERHAGTGRPMLDSFTIHEGDFGEDGIIVLRVRRVFGANSACDFEIVSVPQPGEALVITSFAGRDELQHVAVSREAAERWQATTVTAMRGSTASRLSPASPPDRPADAPAPSYRRYIQPPSGSLRATGRRSGVVSRRAHRGMDRPDRRLSPTPLSRSTATQEMPMRYFHTCVCSTLHLPVEERRFIEDIIADSRAGRSVVARTDLSIVVLHDGYTIHVGVLADYADARHYPDCRRWPLATNSSHSRTTR